jgi:hypothetical protein
MNDKIKKLIECPSFKKHNDIISVIKVTRSSDDEYREFKVLAGNKLYCTIFISNNESIEINIDFDSTDKNIPQLILYVDSFQYIYSKGLVTYTNSRSIGVRASNVFDIRHFDVENNFFEDLVDMICSIEPKKAILKYLKNKIEKVV